MWATKFCLLAPFQSETRSLWAVRVGTSPGYDVDHSLCGVPGPGKPLPNWCPWYCTLAIFGNLPEHTSWRRYLSPLPGHAPRRTLDFRCLRCRMFAVWNHSLVGAMAVSDGDHPGYGMLGSKLISSDSGEHEPRHLQAAPAVAFGAADVQHPPPEPCVTRNTPVFGCRQHQDLMTKRHPSPWQCLDLAWRTPCSSRGRSRSLPFTLPLRPFWAARGSLLEGNFPYSPQAQPRSHQ